MRGGSGPVRERAVAGRDLIAATIAMVLKRPDGRKPEQQRTLAAPPADGPGHGAEGEGADHG